MPARILVARAVLCILCLGAAASAGAQARGRGRATPLPPPPPVKQAAEITCPAPLGVGAATKRRFCDVLTGRDPAAGILIAIPPHKGPVTLTSTTR